MSSTVDTSKYCLFIQTLQATEIKSLIDALKDILIHTNIEVTKDGVNILQIGRERMSLVDMRLKAESFQNFYCEKTMILGVNLINMNSLLRTVQSNDILTLFIQTDNRNKLGIFLQDASKNKVTKYMLDLIELEYTPPIITASRPESILTMQASDFQQTCRSLSIFTDEVEIRCAGDQIEFRGKGDYAEQITQFGETEEGVEFKEQANPSRPVQGVFDLKKLMSFAKCSNLSSTIKILMMNDMPMIMEYDITDLGNIKLYISPKTVT